MRLATTVALAALSAFYAHPSAAEAQLDTANIEQIIGAKGTIVPDENVFKVAKPRTDVKVEIGGWHLPPFIGLGSWAAFTPAAHGDAMVMGDTALFEDEVNPVMSVALESGLEVTALHNHFFFDQPKIFFMHIGGMGDATTLATGVKNVWDKIAQIRKAEPVPAKGFDAPKFAAENAITPGPLEAALNVKGHHHRACSRL